MNVYFEVRPSKVGGYGGILLKPLVVNRADADAYSSTG